MGGIVGKPKDCWSYVHTRSLQDITLIQKTLINNNNNQQHIDKNYIYELIGKIYIEMNDKYKSILKKCWKQYDLNHDGFLSRSELQDLVRDSLISMKKTYLLLLVTHVMTEMSKLTKQNMMQMATKAGRTLTIDEISGIDHRFEQDTKLAITIGDAQMDLLIQNSITLSDQLWTAMDVPSDGHVTQAKFLQHYMQAANQVVSSHLGTNPVRPTATSASASSPTT